MFEVPLNTIQTIECGVPPSYKFNVVDCNLESKSKLEVFGSSFHPLRIEIGNKNRNEKGIRLLVCEVWKNK